MSNAVTERLRAQMALPVIAAPMLLVSGPQLVIAACRSGVVGSFPTLNARTAEICEQWFVEIAAALTAARDEGGLVAPYAVNIIVHEAANRRLEADLALAERFQAPIVITSVGDPRSVVERVHAYGGIVSHDVATLRHADKAIAAGVDALVLLTAGAGGHTGKANPFAFVRDIRRMWEGPVALAGALSDGTSVRAAEILGADFAYMGTRFAATAESLAPLAYKNFLLSQQLSDVITTDRISGLDATFLRGSIAAAGLDPDNLPPRKALFEPDLPDGIKAWRDVWSGGHGVGLIEDIPSVGELIARLLAEYVLAGVRYSSSS